MAFELSLRDGEGGTGEWGGWKGLETGEENDGPMGE